MARQKGPLKYVGSIGDIRHFKIKGTPGYFAGMKGGPTGEQVLNAPEFVRTRENMSEFAACAMAGKAVRVGFSSLMKQMADPQLTGRLTAIMKKINLEDGSEARGQRAILISQETGYLKGLDFNKSISFSTVLTAPYSLSKETDRSGSTFSAGTFNPKNSLNAPAGATHFRIINALAVVSDYSFNQDSGNYEPVDQVFNEKSAISYSAYLDVKQPTGAVDVIASLGDVTGLSLSSSVLNAVGVEFYQQVNGEYYLLNRGHALKLVDIF